MNEYTKYLIKHFSVLTPAKTTFLICTFLSLEVNAQDNIPTTNGFSGYLITGPGFFNVQSNLLVTGPPLLQDAGYAEIESIYEGPTSKSVLAWPFAGEINYTNAKSRTQFFFGNRLEDILRLDVPFGLGIRQELGDSSIMALSYLATPAELKFWADPYIEGEERERTVLNFRGVRWRWGRMFKTGLELTTTLRWYKHDLENSGDWLIEEGRLNPTDQELLNRDGNVFRAKALYRIDLNRKHRFEPAFSMIVDNHEGKAIANDGFASNLTYIYFSPKVVLDVNLGYGQRNARSVNPVYDEKADSERYGGAVMAFVPFKKSKTGIWSFWGTVEIFKEDVKINFFDSQFSTIMVGVMWRHIKK